MPRTITIEQLTSAGLDRQAAEELAQGCQRHVNSTSPAEAWTAISTRELSPAIPFEVHHQIYDAIFADWDTSAGPRPAWTPSQESIEGSNIWKLVRERGFCSYQELHRWSITDRPAFWESMVRHLDIAFQQPAERLTQDPDEVDCPRWFPGAKMNIAQSCFSAAPDSTAIVFQPEGSALESCTVAELESLTNRVANGLTAAGFQPGDAIGICMAMTAESVAIYLGLVKAGCVAVSIADSFAAEGIGLRLKISKAKGIFTQDVVLRGGKTLPLYERVVAAEAGKAIVLPAAGKMSCTLRASDLSWDKFLSANDSFDPVPGAPGDPINILFSSGTTGDPKAIPWSHTTPIRSAADGYLHHDIRPGDVVAWPTNLGWMMGPWLIFASMINRAIIGLYYGAPTGRPFGEFVQNAKVNMLGVVPSLVKAWRQSDCMQGLDWQAIRAFSSTGEASNAGDMLFLMSLAGYKPVIEYCGGTEIGGGYITGTVVQPASPATFSTPALGLDFAILDESGSPADNGELLLIPPSIGLSTELLNRDHHEVYFEGTPAGPGGSKLRRHGDQMERLPGGYYRAHGRVDDTMNLGGIKVSSAEIERVVNRVEGVSETAAIAVPPEGGGPDMLVIFTVLEPGAEREVNALQQEMQKEVKAHLNPLFKIQDVVVVDALPRTASNKVMRRKLRTEYGGKH